MAKIESTSATVRGPLHEKLGIERQDAAGHIVLKEFSSHIIVVADGHGDPSCARSATGSSFAVEATQDRLTEFARAVSTSAETHRALIKGALDLTRLTDSIVSSWSSRVAAHYSANPDPELDERIAKASDAIEAKAIREHLYGTTLVAALLMPDSCLLIQQGDGCCALIYSDGTVRENEDVIIEDPLCVGNVTTSLSDRAAASEIRTSLIIYDDAKYVIGCFVGSDGIDKSLPPDGGTSDFAVAATLARLDSGSNLEWTDWLTNFTYKTTNDGSGDDASAACYVDITSLRNVELALRTQHERFSKAQELVSLRKKLNSMQRKRAFYLSGKAQVSDEQRATYLNEYDALAQEVKALEKELGDQSDWEAIERSFLEAAKRPPQPIGTDWEESDDYIADPQPRASERQVAEHQVAERQTEMTPSASEQEEAYIDIDMGRSPTARIISIVVPVVGALVMAGVALFIIFRPVKEVQSDLATKMSQPMSTCLVGMNESISDQVRVTAAAVEKIYAAQDELIDTDKRARELTDAGINLSALKEAARKGLVISLSDEENGNQTSVPAVPVEGQEQPSSDETVPSIQDEQTDGERQSGSGFLVGGVAHDSDAQMRFAVGETEDDGYTSDTTYESDGEDSSTQDWGRQPGSTEDNSTYPNTEEDSDAAEDSGDESDGDPAQSDSEPDSSQDVTPSEETPLTTTSVAGTTFVVKVNYNGPDVDKALNEAVLEYRNKQRSNDLSSVQQVIDDYASGKRTGSSDGSVAETQSGDSETQRIQGDDDELDVTETDSRQSEPQTTTCTMVIVEESAGEWRILQGEANLKLIIANAMGMPYGSEGSTYADDSTSTSEDSGFAWDDETSDDGDQWSESDDSYWYDEDQEQDYYD